MIIVLPMSMQFMTVNPKIIRYGISYVYRL